VPGHTNPWSAPRHRRERVAAQPGEQADTTDLHGPGRAVEADRQGVGEQFAGGSGCWLAPRGVPGIPVCTPFTNAEKVNVNAMSGLRVAVSVDVDPVDRVGVEFAPVVGAGIGGGALVGFELMISTVLSGSQPTLNTNRSVKSRRLSSPGNLRLSALKWFDMVAP